jgi:HAD superfamily hydrolase (TIGR01509 family)
MESAATCRSCRSRSWHHFEVDVGTGCEGVEVQIKALIFDMDGLLVDTEALAYGAMDAFLAKHALERRQEIHDQMLGRRIPEAMAIVKEGYGLDHAVDELISDYTVMRRDALVGNVRPMPGAVEVVQFGHDAGLRVGLASSGLRDQVTLSLNEAGLQGMFEVEVTGDDVSRGKPAPDLFLRAASLLGVDPKHCVVFEDAPAGVAAAINAGMRAVAVPNEHSQLMEFPIKPEAVLETLHDAIPWLKRNGVTVGARPGLKPPG